MVVICLRIFLLFFVQQTEGFAEEKICGRPLGMAFDTQGNNLIVADAYYGIWSVDLNNGKKSLLVAPNEEFDGKVCLISTNKRQRDNENRRL